MGRTRKSVRVSIYGQGHFYIQRHFKHQVANSKLNELLHYFSLIELSEIGELVKQLEAEREGGEEKYKEKIAELEARAEGLEEEKQELTSKLEEMRRVRKEVTTDNRRLAEIVVVMEGEGEEAAAMLESLRRERKELRRECVQLRERGV